MARDVTDTQPVTTRDQLVTYLEDGCKPPDALRIGTEHEKFPFYKTDFSPVPYEGEFGIRRLLEGMANVPGWQLLMEGDHPIGLVETDTNAAISLEPAGQFELSGAQMTSIHETATELERHLQAASHVGQNLGIGFLGLGHTPSWSRDDLPIMPKGRYRIMMNYMPKVGSHGLDMMLRTCTVQANLDFTSEADMVKKLRVSLALQPIMTALFANSPFTEGRPNGFLSMRSQIWRDTDRARTGMMPFAFETGMSFERYVDFALDVPMYFVKRGETYHDVAGASFRDLMQGKLEQLPGENATLSDWANHLSTIFPEVRLKRYLEMRGADCGPEDMILALPALCVGLLYHSPSLEAAWQMVRHWTAEDRQFLRDCVPEQGLRAVIANRTVEDIARDVINLAREGLKTRALRNHDRDETKYLAPLETILETHQSLADKWLAAYQSDWKKDVTPVYTACRLGAQ